MAIADTSLPAALPLTELVGTFWYCPAPNLPAPIAINGPAGPTTRWVQDQTVWHITSAGLGYFFGTAATNLGSLWSYSSIIGSVTPEGSVLIAFQPETALVQSADGLGVSALTIGSGELLTLAGEPAFLMQMASGNGAVTIAHWAYMLGAAQGDAAWNDLPGTVPRGMDELFRAGATAGSTVPGVDATGNRRDEAIFGSNRADRLAGGGGADTLTAGDEADLLFGGNGDDLLIGGAGRDTLRGGGGNDVLAGGAGLDQLHGGAGADRFLFGGGETGAPDLIRDFAPGLDLIALDRAAFGLGAAPGPLDPAMFTANAAGRATAPEHRLIYESDAAASDGMPMAAAPAPRSCWPWWPARRR